MSAVPDLQAPNLLVRELGRVGFEEAYARMRTFTEARHASAADELWVLEHDPVYTLGQAGRAEHVLDRGDIPVVATDRGGQVTYHGPGQLVVYVLLDLRRRGYGVRELVARLEQAIVSTLGGFGVAARSDPAAPGVYVGGRKIAALGLRVRRGCSYHGLSLNVAMDLEPFQRIDPCGYRGLEVTSLERESAGPVADVPGVAAALLPELERWLMRRGPVAGDVPRRPRV